MAPPLTGPKEEEKREGKREELIWAFWIIEVL